MWTVKVISQGYQKEFVHRIQSIQLRLVKVARQFQVPGYLAGILGMVPHLWGTGIGLDANLHTYGRSP